MNGGEVIGSGGYGCVFRPALKCRGKTRRKNNITKLMTKKHTLAEFNEATKYKNILKKIPNYKKYYLLDGITMCEPDLLTNEDLKGFNSKCSALKKDSISKESINMDLDKIMSLNMPDGGVDLGDYLDLLMYNQMSTINLHLIDLLLNGIIPMNNHEIYHSDIKDSNILVKKNVKLIDWGLSTICKKKTTEIPDFWINRPFMYNVPFSVIMFTDQFVDMHEKFYSQHNGNPSINHIHSFVYEYILFWNSKRGDGHYSAIKRIFNNFFNNDVQHVPLNEQENFIFYQYTIHTIIDYISKIIVKYTKNGKIRLMDYINEIYVKNVDIWGFIMCYNSIVERLYFNYNKLSDPEQKLFTKLIDIMCKHLYTTSITPINIQDLVKELKSLNPIFNKCHQVFKYTSVASFNGSASNIDSSIYNTQVYEKPYRKKSLSKKFLKSRRRR